MAKFLGRNALYEMTRDLTLAAQGKHKADTAVSYTHLDVYKRQAHGRSMCLRQRASCFHERRVGEESALQLRRTRREQNLLPFHRSTRTQKCRTPRTNRNLSLIHIFPLVG